MRFATKMDMNPWLFADGRNWTLTPSPGMPLQPGDQLSVLRRTASGFIAVGTNIPGGDQAKSSPVAPCVTTWMPLEGTLFSVAAEENTSVAVCVAEVEPTAVVGAV